MSMRVLLTVTLASVVGLGAQPLGAGEGLATTVSLTPRTSESMAPGAPARPGSSAPVSRVGLPPAPMTGRPLWQWPLVPRPTVLRNFVAPPTPYGPGHRGLDLRTSVGAEVLSVAPGEVTHAGPVAGRGTVTVAHAGGLSSTYEPVDSTVEVGELVEAGGVLGVVGPAPGEAGTATGGHCGGGRCLHLGARRGSVYLDPLPLLIGGRAVLLPLAGLPVVPRHDPPVP